jgi:predicted HicB family RNase H-like nuclease
VTMFDPRAYTITIKKLKIDDERLFRASVAELPDVAPYGQTFQEAYELAIDAIETLRAVYEEQGRAFPEPVVEDREFSGRVTLRIPKSVHRQASMAATLEGVSLNQWLASVISQGVTFAVAAASVGTRVPMYVCSAGANMQVLDKFSGHITTGKRVFVGSAGFSVFGGPEGVSTSGAPYLTIPNDLALTFRPPPTRTTPIRRRAEERKGTLRTSRKGT